MGIVYILTIIGLCFVIGWVIEYFNGVHNKNINYNNVNEIQWYISSGMGIYDGRERVFGFWVLVTWVFFPVYVVYLLLQAVIDGLLCHIWKRNQ